MERVFQTVPPTPTEAVALPETLTPDSIPESDDYCNELIILSSKANNKVKDELLKLEQENVIPTLLPSPPPQQVKTIAPLLRKKRCPRVLVSKNENNADNNNKPPPISKLEEGCKWCQRCGTIETPRWRYGPGGPLSLCNACHLRWKTLGKPAEGYSASTFPPPFYNVVPVRTKRKMGKNATTKSRAAKRVKKEDNIKKESATIEDDENKENLKFIPSAPAPTATTEEDTTTPPPPLGASCTHCHTTNTPLWRRGPSGLKTLCNACGLKWSIKPESFSSLERKQVIRPPKKSTPSVEKSSNATTQQQKKVPLLHQKKEYVKHGLYSIETRLLNPPPTAQKFSFALPIHHGEFLMSKEKDFELPPDILQERELGIIRGLFANRQPAFTKIRSNIFVERKPQLKPDDQAVCQCVAPSDETQMGCGDDCINRMLFYECDSKLCPCGPQCSNQRFQRKEKTKGLQVFQTDSRGWGLRALVDIQKGDLVIEYRGEIISHELCEERMCTTYVNEKNFYFLDYCNGEVIDACTKGTEARFINHSCDPNCHIEKWSLKGESHFGVFASKDIQAKAELFYDYNFSTFNGSVESQQVCYCGSRACRGTIGKKGSYATPSQSKK